MLIGHSECKFDPIIKESVYDSISAVSLNQQLEKLLETMITCKTFFYVSLNHKLERII